MRAINNVIYRIKKEESITAAEACLAFYLLLAASAFVVTSANFCISHETLVIINSNPYQV